MTIELTQDQFYEQFQETDEEQLQWDTSDDLDVTYKFDNQISQGWWREIELREGLWLRIDRHKQSDRLVLKHPEQKGERISCSFMLSGKGRTSWFSTLNESETLWNVGKYSVESNGIGLGSTEDFLDAEPCSFIEIKARPEVMRSFAVSSKGGLPKNIRHLIKLSSEVSYHRRGDTQPLMNGVLQQILRCPCQGILKRMYLESKVIELMVLIKCQLHWALPSFR